MHVTLQRQSFLTELQLCSSVVEKRVIMPIASCVAISAEGATVRLRATNFEQSVSTIADGSVKDEGGCAVELAPLLEMVRAVATDTVELQLTSSRLAIRAGLSAFELPALDIADFPVAQDTDGVTREVGRDDLLALLRATVYATNADESRFVLAGPVLTFGDDVRSAATDGHRMALAYAPSPSRGPKCEGLLTLRAITAIQKLMSIATEDELSFTFGDGHIAIDAGRRRILLTRRQDFNLPNMDTVLAKFETGGTAIVNRAELLAGVRRCMVASPETTRELSVTFTRGRIVLGAASAATSRTAKDELPADYSGDEVTLYFRGTYLAQALEGIVSDLVSMAIGTTEPLRGCLISPSVEGAKDRRQIALVMSMQHGN